LLAGPNRPVLLACARWATMPAWKPRAALRLCADERASTSMIIGTGLMICPTAGAKRRHARRETMPPFHFRAFLRGCLLGTSILLGLCVLGAVAVGLLWRFMFAPWW
jgi:hypothetical protein